VLLDALNMERLDQSAALREPELPGSGERLDHGARDQEEGRWHMNPDDFPAPKDGLVLTHFLVVADQDRSREFYRRLFDAQVLLERDPVIMKVANSWLILNVGGGPTDDKPTVTLTTPADPNRTSAFLNVRVADIAKVYQEWSAKGAEFLTEPKDHGREIRAYVRDPDGHLIEVGQTTGMRS
jgi:lactoylglutathione lyase